MNATILPIKLDFVLGTRPEAIKLSQLIRLASKDARFSVRVFSTGQHREMIRPIFNFFDISPDVDFDLMKPGQTLQQTTVAVMTSLEKTISQDPPDWLIVQGDTTTVFSASLFGFYNNIKIAHVEAGLRTYDIHSPFPEEFYRRATGLIADFHFAPTTKAAENLLKESTPPEKIQVTGNTGIDALFAVKEGLESSSVMKQELEQRFKFLSPDKKIILLTTHRRESFGEPMKNIFLAMNEIVEKEDVQIIIPLHMNPLVRATAQEILKPSDRIHIIDPLDYFSFVYVMMKSTLILTDSGGIQEEAPSLGKPVLVLRENTERPEALEAGTSKLIGVQKDTIIREVQLLLNNHVEYQKMAQAKNPFGDGQASLRILDTLFNESQNRTAKS